MEELQDRVEFLEEIIGDILDAFTTHDESTNENLQNALSEVWSKFVSGGKK